MNITIDEFQKMDIRVGTIIGAEVPQWSHYVMKLKVDFASEAKSSKDRSSRRVRIEPKSREVRSGGESEIGERIIFAGIMNFFKAKDLIGKQSLFIVNLEPKKIGPEGDFSQGMMLMATPTHKATAGEAVEELPPVFLSPKKKVPNGTKIM